MERYDLAIIGAGPAGISLAAEARNAGIPAARILIVEKGPAHSFAIRKFYPEGKPVLANYKGLDANCEGIMCIPDLSKEQTLDVLGQAIAQNELTVHYNETVDLIRRLPTVDDRPLFHLRTSARECEARVVVIAIGILGRPNKPDYPIPAPVKARALFDITSEELRGLAILVVGGGDSASEYCQYLAQRENKVALSYRGAEFARMNPINRVALEQIEARGAVTILRGSNVARIEDDGSRPRVVFKEDLPPRTVDRVVFALGGTTPEAFLRAAGIAFEGGWPEIKEGGETNVPGLFLAGDLTAGRKGGSIITAFNSSARAMRAICDNYLECKLEI